MQKEILKKKGEKVIFCLENEAIVRGALGIWRSVCFHLSARQLPRSVIFSTKCLGAGQIPKSIYFEYSG